MLDYQRFIAEPDVLQSFGNPRDFLLLIEWLMDQKLHIQLNVFIYENSIHASDIYRILKRKKSYCIALFLRMIVLYKRPEYLQSIWPLS